MSSEKEKLQIIEEEIREINNQINKLNNMTAEDIHNYMATGTNLYDEIARLTNEKTKLEKKLECTLNGQTCIVSGGRRYKKKKTIKRRKYTKKNNKSKKSNKK